MIEIEPIIFRDNKLLLKQDYKLEKMSDKSVKITFFPKGDCLQIVPSVLLGGIPSVWYNNQKVDFGAYVIKSYQDEGRPGVDIFFRGFPFKRIGLIPRVLLGDEEKEYKKRQLAEKKSAYEKEHGILWK